MVCNGDRYTGCSKFKRGGIGAVVVGGDNCALQRHKVVTVEIGANGRRKHHAGPVIVGKHQRPLNGTGGKNNLLGTERNQGLAGFAKACIVIHVALEKHHEIIIIKSLGRRPCADFHG